jgi:hypothetical protein
VSEELTKQDIQILYCFSRKMGRRRPVSGRGKTSNSYKVLFGNAKEQDNLGDTGVD